MLPTDRIRDLYSWAYAWRTADDEGETDLSSVRDSNRAEFDAWLTEHDRQVKADAWDEGAIWGFDERGPIDGTRLQLVPGDNPYR